MPNLPKLKLILARLEGLNSPSASVDHHISSAMGWRDIRMKAGKWHGTCPNTGCFLRLPKFTQSVDVALTTIPSKWVESYHRRFDGVSVAKCQPRGDLGLETVQGESKMTAIAFMIASTKACIAMLQKEKGYP